MTALHLPRAVYNRLRAHGEETYPHECCGALLGHPVAEGWQVDSLLPAANAVPHESHHRYEIAPAELVKIVREARRLGLEIAGFYHSHPDRPAHWSASDLAHAHWLGCTYVIIEVAQGNAAATNAFLLAGATEEDKHFAPQTIQIEDSHPTAPSS
ncbi:MAG: M67 family metallopeptidase [Terracidiphilus sp.]